MSDPVPFTVRVPAGREPLEIVERLLAFAGEPPLAIVVQVEVETDEEVARWRSRVTNAEVDNADPPAKIVRGEAPLAAARALVAAVGDAALELCWDVGYWNDETKRSLTPGADNYVYLRLNAHGEEWIFVRDPGVVELEITINSHTREKEQVAAVLAASVGTTLG